MSLRLRLYNSATRRKTRFAPAGDVAGILFMPSNIFTT